jgi:hypothetical protein
MTPSRVDWIMQEIQRTTRRMQNHREVPEHVRVQYAAYLCELWEELHDTQRALHKTYNELAVMDPSGLEQSNVAA